MQNPKHTTLGFLFYAPAMDCLAGEPWPFFYWGVLMKNKPQISGLCILLMCVMLPAGTKTSAGNIKAMPMPIANHADAPPVFKHATPEMWQYLRRGLNYLESPEPLSRPEDVSSAYVHPDGKGFGPFGFSPEAYKDVQRVYPYFRQFAWQDVLGSSSLYDLATQAFADWLLGNLQDNIPEGATDRQVFDALHKAWNLGLTGFKNGRSVVSSRIRRAEEFVRSM
jgi:hypothetical protein